MRKLLLVYIIALLPFIGFTQNTDEALFVKSNITLSPKQNSYQQAKHQVKQYISGLDSQLLNYNLLSKKFTDLLVNTIIPHWYGTTWSFEGHTATPKQGEIACGYFVSTTLRDLGININRYRLAQQSPYYEAKSLQLKTGITTIEGNTPLEIIQKIKTNFKEGIYFLGLNENHVGFLLIRNGKVFFIHSNYAGDNGVEIELASASIVFTSFRKFYLVPLSNNKELLDS